MVFYFNLHECGVSTYDYEGLDLPNFEEAERFAVVAARGIIAADVMAGCLRLQCHIDIMDEPGQRVGRVTFAAAISITS